MTFGWFLTLEMTGPSPAVLFLLLTAIPALIAVIGALNLHGGTEERIRAWVLLILGALVTMAMLAPFHPESPDALISMQVTLLFAYGYVLADWGRQALRYSLQPFWAHALVALCLIVALGLLIYKLARLFLFAAP